MAPGYGAFCNPSCHANADHACDRLQGVIRTSAHRPILRGEEITIRYGGLPDCPGPVWFGTVEGRVFLTPRIVSIFHSRLNLFR
ncbi:SET domain-containing protein [Methanoculleus sp. FWC-SCC3]|uniref:SET domain-containing protein n=1 Tax=Methanoculleus methanifontis TaxID=2584086 RepID=A0ABT8LZZ3_9EURY|nr:SET domain-containing protein-lysine N-methyltransferase [Methanoculleus sp. FWC-SCC3]MDN7012349.1 SET domain-containing protein [Methanoculleus sp. FWC-SCC3]